MSTKEQEVTINVSSVPFDDDSKMQSKSPPHLTKQLSSGDSVLDVNSPWRGVSAHPASCPCCKQASPATSATKKKQAPGKAASSAFSGDGGDSLVSISIGASTITAGPAAAGAVPDPSASSGAGAIAPPSTAKSDEAIPFKVNVHQPSGESSTKKRRSAKELWKRLYLAMLSSRLLARLEPLRLGEDDLDTPLPHAAASISIGELDNGLHYFVQSCSKPPHSATLRLVFRCGSSNEDEKQLGLAHFLEHAAFLKLKSYDKGELIKFLESVGSEFGAHINAHTSFSETVYKLNIPISDDANDGVLPDEAVAVDGKQKDLTSEHGTKKKDRNVLAESLKILGEWASGIVFDEALVENERNVVGEEHRTGLGLNDRLFKAWLPEVFGHWPAISERLPIGGRGDIDGQRHVRSAPVAELARFYRDHYRPEVAAVVAVGDFKKQGGHARVIALIEKHLGPGAWPRTPPETFRRPPRVEKTAPLPPPPPLLPTATATDLPAIARTPRCIIFRDEQVRDCSVEFGIVMPFASFSGTARRLRRQLVRDMWFSVLENRLEKVIENSGATPPFDTADAESWSFEGAPMASFRAWPQEEGRWPLAFERLLVEVLRLARFGILPHELERCRGVFSTAT